MWSDPTSLSIEQITAVTVDAARLCILAGPGTGKTRVLTRRIARRVHAGETPPERVAALTFTRTAALEMRDRLAGLDVHGVTVASFHGFALRLLARRYADGFGQRPNLVSRQQICRALLAERDEGRLTARQLDSEVGWAAARMLAPADYLSAAQTARRSLPIGFADMAGLIDAYHARKAKSRVMDFDDLLLLVLRALREDPAWAAATRWSYRHFYVDEYQDTSTVQLQLLEELVGEAADLCVVGDPCQSIFAFAGAQSNAFDTLHDRFPEAQTVRLSNNFRSATTIVDAANSLLTTPMTSDRAGLVGQVTVRSYIDVDGEARAVAQALRLAGPPWSDHAVLARTHRALDPVEAACLQAGIPTYRTQDLLRRAEVRWACKELSKLAGQIPAASARSELVAIVDDILARYRGDQPPDEAVNVSPLSERFDDVPVERSESLEMTLVRHHLDELRGLLEEFLSTCGTGSLDDFFFWLKATVKDPTATRAPKGAVDLRTIHRAKGLEWRHIHLVSCTDDLLPLRYADEAEERRLMFVAVTRASEHVACSWAMNGSDRRGRPVRQDPSPYLATIENVVASSVDAARNSEPAKAAVAQARQILAAISEKPSARCPRGRQTVEGSLLISARNEQGDFDDAAALAAMAARLGTSAEELTARMGTDYQVRAQARLVLAATRELSMGGSRS